MTNEEKILALLKKQSEMLEKHDTMLEKHGEILEKHGEMLEKHGKMLEKHSEMLEKLDRRMDSLDERQTKTEIILENTIVPRLDALAEGQKALMEALAPKSRVEALEEEVDLLKTVIRSLSRDVAELKKAQ